MSRAEAAGTSARSALVEAEAWSVALRFRMSHQEWPIPSDASVIIATTTNSSATTGMGHHRSDAASIAATTPKRTEHARMVRASGLYAVSGEATAPFWAVVEERHMLAHHEESI
mmetsp:Transcript_87682/g.165340  ORF Transcript_87682/g.165340 Transcript_87682/m.165340 type:complete len:114 (+) Transcript_87682:1244-1585(+)